MTTLLIIKVKDDYIRIKGDEYQLCPLNKASVFPPVKLTEVKEHAEKVKQLFKTAELYTLELKERPFLEGE